MVTTEEARFTREDYLRLPEGFRAELLDGLLVKEPAPSGWHQILVGKVHLALAGVVGPGRVVMSPIDVFVDRHNVLQPDVLVLPESSPVRRGTEHVGLPLLVIEVLSPSTAHRDRYRKVGTYLRAGVEEVWLVDPETETAQIHTVAGTTDHGPGESPASRVVPGFALDLAELFRD